MPGLSLRRLTKTFGPDAPAVGGIDLDVADGEFMVLVGPSGCGKSTTLRMIAGLEAPDAGTIAIGGREVQSLEPGARDVAMVFQGYALYPHMSVERNLGFGLRKRGLSAPERARRVREVAETLEIADLLHRRPAALSGGQRQRVAMGRAIVRDPALFLFDEPLSNLDARLRSQMRTEIKRMSRIVRTTSIYVTHDQVEAMTMADRIVVMNHGRIEQIASPSEIYHRPATRFVATFLGSPAMAILPASIAGGRATLLGTTFDLPRSRAEGIPSGRLDIGLRPEDVHLGGPVPASVDVVESLGVETLLHLTSGSGHRLALRLSSPAGLRPGARVGLSPDLSRAHLMDPGTGRVLSSPPMPADLATANGAAK